MDKEYIEREIAKREIVDWATIYQMENHLDREDALTALNNIPAADVVEVRHGYWIDKGWDGDFSWQIDGRGNCWHVYECSECKSQICGSPKTKWCSYCGAKMDKEKYNDEA